MRARFLISILALAISGCAAPAASQAPPASDHGEQDAQAERVKEALADEFGMSFEPAGPHHELGTSADDVELDLVGVPVEEVVLSVPSRDRSAAVEAGLAYLPHLRDLLHGPDPVWDWVAEALACREDADSSCNVSMSQGNLSARFTDGGSDYIVLVITRE
jgi:hypothetical protein